MSNCSHRRSDTFTPHRLVAGADQIYLSRRTSAERGSEECFVQGSGQGAERIFGEGAVPQMMVNRTVSLVYRLLRYLVTIAHRHTVWQPLICRARCGGHGVSPVLACNRCKAYARARAHAPGSIYMHGSPALGPLALLFEKMPQTRLRLACLIVVPLGRSD